MSGYSKPLPVVDKQTKPFWDAAKRHELCLPRCLECGRARSELERWCPYCGSQNSKWAKMSGRGTIWSHCDFHKAYFKGFEADLPYNVAVVELEEGPKLFTNIVQAKPEEIRVGVPVEVVFDDVTAEVSLVKFKTRN
jgi:uncharacterized OB-fold protein